ncbi:RE1-silencing transcription factor [Discoglossus pictus]
MATQMVTQAAGLFSNNGNFGIALDGGLYDLHDLSKPDHAAPRLVMLANVALTGEMSGSCDYTMEEDRQMTELTTVDDNNFSDSEGEKMEDSHESDHESGDSESTETETPESEKDEGDDGQIAPSSNSVDANPEKSVKPSSTDNKNKCSKSKPFRCKPCQYKAESEEEFVHHIKIHSAKKFIDNDTKKKTPVKESEAGLPEEVNFSKGPIQCDRCGYNTNRFDHYLAHLKHHNKLGENERVYKCSICTYSTVSEYHWKKHLRNHFPRKVYTCSQCSYFSDRKNNYIQHIRTHTGERPYQCIMCTYSSSQKTHLTRHMRTHSGEKPFKCEQCSYVASNQHEVTRHARQVHNGPKPLTCPHCEYKTADRSNFKKHVELHVNPRQFLCPVCDYAASKKCNLQYHIKSRHSGCVDITMDVSKVKLRTKKEVGVTGFAAKKQTEKRSLKINSDTEEKPPCKTIKVEKKDACVKDKKRVSSSFIGQVKTRSSRSSTRIRYKLEAEKSVQISSKAKCAKRKPVDTSEKPVKGNDIRTGKIRKNVLLQQKKRSKLVLKREIKSTLSRKKICIKKKRDKKHFKNKHRRKISKKIIRKKSKSKQTKDRAVERDTKYKTQNCKNNIETPEAVSNVDETHQAPQEEDVQDVATETLQSVETTTALNASDNLSSCSQDTASPTSLEGGDKPDGLLPEENVDSGELVPEQSSSNIVETTCELPIVEKPKNISNTNGLDELTELDQCKDKFNENEPTNEPQKELDTLSESIEHNTENSCALETCETPQGDDETNETEVILQGASSPSTNNQDLKDVQTSPSPFNASSSESVDIEEDEGIHSHDGSDISDNISERSDDSGLNGTPSVPETIDNKASMVTNSTEENISEETFVCIFCDRAFRKEEEYTKHLKRHLVNVYYLEKAAKDQA